jgi:predicted extracellular nuclease
MLNLRPLLLTAFVAALAACAVQPAPPTVKPTTPNPRVYGTVDVSFDTLNGVASARVNPFVRTQAALPDSVATLTPTSFTNLEDGSGSRFLNANFTVTNTSGADLTNLTLYAYAQNGTSVGGTAIKNITDFGGFATPAVEAQLARPAHGTNPSGGSVVIEPTRADMQIFQPSDVANIQTGFNLGTILEYGFVTRNGNSRTITSNGTGTLTIGVKVPSGTGAYKFVMTFAYASESATRVTRSPEETTTELNARASTVNATEAVLVGSDTDTANVPTIRLANAKISTQPAFLLEPSCPVGAPAVTNTIMGIQGTGATTTVSGVQTVEGVVVGDYQGSTGLNGFYIQDRYGDGNAATSDAMFVFASTAPDVNVGDLVRVTGTAAEFVSGGASQTQLAGTVTVTACGTRPTPQATTINFPLPNGQTDLEPYEGMLVQIPAQLTVTELFQLGQFGQVTLASSGSSNISGTDNRLDQFTQFNAPSVSGNAAYLAEAAKRRIVLDDGRSTQNPDPIKHGRGGVPLSATNTLRGGDTVTNLSGVMDHRNGAYRVQPIGTVNFQAVNAREATPTVSGSLRVASFNVLNYFVTLNSINDSSANDNPADNFTNPCGNSQDPRGANTAAEFTRQKDKIVTAIRAINADVLGVIEMQNNGADASSAIVDLVTAVNAGQPVADQYAAIADPATPEFSGCDAIKVAFIYKPSSVTPANGTTATVGAVTVASGAAFTVPNGYDGNGDSSAAFDTNNRKPIAVTFTQNSNSAAFTAVMNHFKSKSSSAGGAGDTDALDGQGQSNGTRVRASQDLKAWLATNPTGTTDPDYLLMGDFNAYAREDPMTTLEPTYTNLSPNTSYSYVFDGFWGSLDHAAGNASLSAQVAGVQKWHINADEPTALDYNIQIDNGTVIKTPAQQTSLYNTDPFRSSDHDAVIVGLNLGGSVSCVISSVTVGGNAAMTVGGTQTATPTVNSTPANCNNAVTWASDNTSVATVSGAGLVTAQSVGTATITATSVADNTKAGTLSITVSAATCTVNSVTVSGGSSVTVGGTLNLIGTVTSTPSACDTAGVTWSSSDTTKATVSPTGVVTGVAAGSAIITATSVTDSSKTGTANVTVTSSAAGGQIVIAEVYGGGGNAGASFTNDYVVLFNRSNATVSLSGLSVQYASATGTGNFAVAAPLSGSLNAGQYYLVQLASGGAVGAALPAPDVSGTTNMSGSAGKVILANTATGLACNGGSAPCDGTQLAQILDLVGYGSANFFEGAAATPALTVTTVAMRALSGCTDTNSNSADFTAGSGSPKNTASPSNVCP